MSEFVYPERVELARLPTPLVPIERLSEELGVEVLVKRDDLTGVELSGNKIRKLEFLLADALAQGADTVITGGGEQSNHCRATALAATRLGLKSALLLRTQDAGKPPPTRGNILLDRLAGAEIIWITKEQWQRRGEMFQSQGDAVRAAGGKPYIIPEGGSNAMGAWGYIRAADELRRDLAGLPRVTRTTIVNAVGSGGTHAGLLLGAHMLGLTRDNVSVAGINVCDDRDYFLNCIGRICTEFDEQFGHDVGIGAGDIEIVDGYVGRGYALSRPEELSVLADVARKQSLLLDPVYTGKAFYGLTQELRRDPRRFGDRVVFVHTGGVFGLFPVAEEIAAVL